MKNMNRLFIFIAFAMMSCKNGESHENNESKQISSTEEVTPSSDGESHSDVLKTNDFWALGNEPFWNLTIDSKNIALKTMEDTLNAPSVMPNLDENTKRQQYLVETESLNMTISIEPDLCSDTMSDRSYPYSVTVVYTSSSSESSRTLKGCGAYSLQEGLGGTWTLHRMDGRIMEASDYGRGLPTLTIDTHSFSFNGSTGCNSMSGNLVVEPATFAFSKIRMTKALCGHGQENEDAFLQNLNEVSSYEIREGLLHLLAGGKEVLVFQQMKEE